MKKLCVVMCLYVFALVPAAYGESVNFDSVPTGSYSSLTFSDFVLTFPGGNGHFNIVPASPGPPISGQAAISYYQNPGPDAFLVTPTSLMAYFSIAGGDYDQDTDYLHLRAYDAFNNLIGSNDNTVPNDLYGGVYVTVGTTTPIDHLQFWSDGDFPGSVYWDSITTSSTTPVPEPGSMVLMVSGLLGLAGAVRRRMIKS